MQARKKPRLEESLPTTTDQAARKTASADVSLNLSPPVADDNGDANANAVTGTKANAVATGSWTLKKDAKLTRAVANSSKKIYVKEYKTDWVTITALVPGRTKSKCRNRYKFLDPSIDRAKDRHVRWISSDEDIKLKNTMQAHGDKDGDAIAALVPGRTRKQCWSRWYAFLDPSIGRASGRKGKWTAVGDSKLKDAVQTHGSKN
jgi:hypothetical protein